VLTMKQTIEIAKQYDLSLSDAGSLRLMANSLDEAIEAAKAFTPHPQISRADLASMSATQINDARENGQLADLMDPKS